MYMNMYTLHVSYSMCNTDFYIKTTNSFAEVFSFSFTIVKYIIKYKTAVNRNSNIMEMTDFLQKS